MTQDVMRHDAEQALPRCHRCGTASRLYGIEAHAVVDWTELRTYVCSQCGGVQTAIVLLRPVQSLSD
jgi:uncharacterized Zn finger protein